MKPISIKRFVEMYLNTNPGTDKKEFTKQLTDKVHQKKNGATCSSCGQSIWAICSVVVGWNGCFTCITGQSDDSGDYEVCFDK